MLARLDPKLESLELMLESLSPHPAPLHSCLRQKEHFDLLYYWIKKMMKPKKMRMRMKNPKKMRMMNLKKKRMMNPKKRMMNLKKKPPKQQPLPPRCQTAPCRDRAAGLSAA